MKQSRRGIAATKPPAIRLILLLAFLVGLVDILLLNAGSGTQPEVVEAEHLLVPVVIRGTRGEDPQPGGILSSTFSLRVPSSLRGQTIEISGVEYFSENGDPLSEGEIFSVRSIDRSWLPRPPGAPERSLVVAPLSSTVIRFRAVPSSALTLQPGDRIYAEIAGRSSDIDFTARSAVSATSDPNS